MLWTDSSTRINILFHFDVENHVSPKKRERDGVKKGKKRKSWGRWAGYDKFSFGISARCIILQTSNAHSLLAGMKILFLVGGICTDNINMSTWRPDLCLPCPPFHKVTGEMPGCALTNYRVFPETEQNTADRWPLVPNWQTAEIKKLINNFSNAGLYCTEYAWLVSVEMPKVKYS